MSQRTKLGLFLFVVLFISGCFVARPKPNFDEKCKLVTKEYRLELSEELTEDLEDDVFDSMFDQCEDILCIIAAPLGAMYAIGASGVITGTVSGSVVVVGNTVHWIERQGKCEDSMTQKAIDILARKSRSIGGKVIDSSTDLTKWIKQRRKEARLSSLFEKNRLRAEQGHAEAQSNLGVMYAEGQGVSQDYKAAVEWFRKAAGQGIAEAQFNLGSMYAYQQP